MIEYLMLGKLRKTEQSYQAEADKVRLYLVSRWNLYRDIISVNFSYFIWIEYFMYYISLLV